MPAMTPPDLPLRDIHLPAEIGWWPPAPGSWMLCALLIVLVLLAWGIWFIRKRRYLRRLALRRLDEISALPDTELARALSRLLRQAAISHFPPHQTAGLNGTAWLEFLDRSVSGQPFSQGVGHCLMDAPYRPDVQIDRAALLALCGQWLKKLPPLPRSRWKNI